MTNNHLSKDLCRPRQRPLHLSPRPYVPDPIRRRGAHDGAGLYRAKGEEWWCAECAIHALVGVRAGSATGYDQRVFFFTDYALRGTDASAPSTTVNIVDRRSDSVTVAYVIYMPGDPNCCPTGGEEWVTFYWNGTQLTPLSPIPPVYNDTHIGAVIVHPG